MTAQTQYAVGKTEVAWDNLSEFGTRVLAATVCYPAVTAGVNTAVLPHPGGWPVVVFLHGYSLLGLDYGVLGDAWARAGFVVVLSNTARWDFVAQEHDGRALHSAAVAASNLPGAFFHGAFDASRFALAGHSMGGGITGSVLANNPGYRCGLALSPVNTGWVVASHITAPFGIVVGTGDWVTPWAWYSQPFYQGVASQDGLKFLYLLNNDCDHMNIAGLSTYPTTLVFERVADVGVGFLRHFLDIGVGGLERAVGPEAQAESRFVMLSQEIVTPQVWAAGPLRIGRRTRLSVAAEEGIGGIIMAPSLGTGVPTSIGMLMLDPNTALILSSGCARKERRIDTIVDVPNLPSLVGLGVAMQAVGATPTLPLLLGSTMVMTIQQ